MATRFYYRNSGRSTGKIVLLVAASLLFLGALASQAPWFVSLPLAGFVAVAAWPVWQARDCETVVDDAEARWRDGETTTRHALADIAACRITKEGEGMLMLKDGSRVDIPAYCLPPDNERFAAAMKAHGIETHRD